MAKYTDKLWLLVAGVAVLGFNLRGAITSLPPVFPELQHRMQLSSAAMSLLAATPVICFGVVSACAAWLARRVGEERALLGAAVLLTCGLALRGLAPGPLLFPGTALAASAIAIMNVLLSSLVKRRWPQRAGLLIGIYLTTLSLGAITGSLVSVPLWHASNGSVRLTLGWLAIPAALAVLAWLPQAGHRTAPGTDASRIRVYRKALAWQVMAFMGLQSLLYYATLSWLPTIFRDRGVSPGAAGNLLALMGLGNFATSLLVPVLAARMRGQRALAVPAVFGLAAGIAGCVWAPVGGAVAWVLLLGVAQGALLALAIFFTMARAADPVTAASLSAFAQSVGYLMASAGPLEVGLLHSATGGWNVPVMLLLILTGAELIAGLLAARPEFIGLTAIPTFTIGYLNQLNTGYQARLARITPYTGAVIQRGPGNEVGRIRNVFNRQDHHNDGLVSPDRHSAHARADHTGDSAGGRAWKVARGMRRGRADPSGRAPLRAAGRGGESSPRGVHLGWIFAE